MEQEKLDTKIPVSKVKYDKKGRYIFLRLSLGGLHEAIGILEDVKADIMSMVRGPRMMRARDNQIKVRAAEMAKEAKLKELRGGENVIKGLKQNPKIIK